MRHMTLLILECNLTIIPFNINWVVKMRMTLPDHSRLKWQHCIPKRYSSHECYNYTKYS